MFQLAISVLKISWGGGKEWLLACLISGRAPAHDKWAYCKKTSSIENGDGESPASHSADKLQVTNTKKIPPTTCK